MASRTPTTPPSRRRLKEEDVRREMLKAARELIYELGITVSLEGLSMEDVIHRAAVPRSSVYRLWPYKGDFIDDLLSELAGPSAFGLAGFDQETLDKAGEVVERNLDKLGTAEDRRAVLLEAIRVGAQQNVEALAASYEWHAYTALQVTARSTRDPEARARISTQLERSEAMFISTMSAFYTKVFELLGVRVRSPYRIEHVAAAGAAVLEGIALRKVLTNTSRDNPPDLHVIGEGGLTLTELVDAPIPGRALDGGTTDWSLASVAYLGVFDALVEPDPDYPRASIGPTA